MISFLSRIFIKDFKNYGNADVRNKYGLLCSIVGIVLNVLLFVAKLFAGLLAHSLAICADGFNNLSDAGSSIVALLGFKASSMKPDSDHPFGHGRYEYISGLVVSVFIAVMGIELVRGSAEKIISGTSEVLYTPLTIAILVLSIAIKVYIFIYNRSIGKKINSVSLVATSVDSLTDCVSTAVILGAGIVNKAFGIDIDGWCGLAVSLLIIVAGVRAAKETIDPLLGKPPSKELVEEISTILLNHKEIVGIHDLVVHDYAPGHIMMSVHAEISDKSNIVEAHELIDAVERELSEKLGCEAVIHMDPVSTDDERVNGIKQAVSEVLLSIHKDVTIHDFRVVEGKDRTNLIFDAVIPYEVKLEKHELKGEISRLVSTLDKKYAVVVEIDRRMV